MLVPTTRPNIAVHTRGGSLPTTSKRSASRKSTTRTESSSSSRAAARCSTSIESDFAGTNKATAVTWSVDDVPGAVKELKAKGVQFEHYDMPGLKLEGDVHVSLDGAMKVAWFRDPDGNILNVVSE